MEPGFSQMLCSSDSSSVVNCGATSNAGTEQRHKREECDAARSKKETPSELVAILESQEHTHTNETASEGRYSRSPYPGFDRLYPGLGVCFQTTSHSFVHHESWFYVMMTIDLRIPRYVRGVQRVGAWGPQSAMQRHFLEGTSIAPPSWGLRFVGIGR